MGGRKDYALREAGLVLAQAKGLFLFDAVLDRKLIPYTWITPESVVTPAQLDSVGMRVRVSDPDTFDFTLKPGPDAFLCEDVVGQWRSEALGKVDDTGVNMSEMASKGGMTRQTLYRIVKGKSFGMQYLFTLRGRNPVVLWEGKPIAAAYARIRRDLEVHGLMEGMP